MTKDQVQAKIRIITEKVSLVCRTYDGLTPTAKQNAWGDVNALLDETFDDFVAHMKAIDMAANGDQDEEVIDELVSTASLFYEGLLQLGIPDITNRLWRYLAEIAIFPHEK